MIFAVAPFAGAWIEILIGAFIFFIPVVAPFAGAWIEIEWCRCRHRGGAGSLPSRERGLKWESRDRLDAVVLSLPSRERGLK